MHFLVFLLQQYVIGPYSSKTDKQTNKKKTQKPLTQSQAASVFITLQHKCIGVVLANMILLVYRLSGGAS